MQTFKVVGMTCSHCKRAVTEAVQGIDPLAAVQVDLASGLVETNSTMLTEKLAEAIRDAGYEVATPKSMVS